MSSVEWAAAWVVLFLVVFLFYSVLSQIAEGARRMADEMRHHNELQEKLWSTFEEPKK